MQEILYIHRKTYYKWKNRYKQKRRGEIEGLSDLSCRPHIPSSTTDNITEVEETILDLRLTKRFGCNRIRFRLKRTIGLSLSTRTIYKIVKRDMALTSSSVKSELGHTSGLP